MSGPDGSRDTYLSLWLSRSHTRRASMCPQEGEQCVAHHCNVGAVGTAVGDPIFLSCLPGRTTNSAKNLRSRTPRETGSLGTTRSERRCGPLGDHVGFSPGLLRRAPSTSSAHVHLDEALKMGEEAALRRLEEKLRARKVSSLLSSHVRSCRVFGALLVRSCRVYRPRTWCAVRCISFRSAFLVALSCAM